MTLFGSPIFAEMEDLDSSKARVRVESIKAVMRFWLERDRDIDAPPAKSKPVSAEERASRVWPSFCNMPLKWGDGAHEQVAAIVAQEIREAESAAWDRAVKHAATFLSHSFPDYGSVIGLLGKCHAQGYL